MTNVEQLPAKREVPTIAAGAPVKAIVPQTFEDAYRIANAVVKSGLAPQGLQTAEKCCIAILHGLEIGLPPMQALQRIAVINGRPCLWGDGAMSLVRGSGLCEYVKEWIDGDGDKMVAYCETRRKGEREPVRRSFSVAEAKEAGLWGKNVWKQFPKRMLQMRPRGFLLRDVYADVLGGMYLAEELQGVEPEPRDVTPVAPPAPSAPLRGEVMPPKPKAEPKRKPGEPRTDSKPYGEVIDAETGEVTEGVAPFSNNEANAYLSDLQQRVKAAPTLEDVLQLEQEDAELHRERIFPPDRFKADKIIEAGKARFSED